MTISSIHIISRIFGRFALDVIGRSGFSSDFKTFSDEDSEIVKQTLVFSNPARNMVYFAFMSYFKFNYLKDLLTNFSILSFLK